MPPSVLGTDWNGALLAMECGKWDKAQTLRLRGLKPKVLRASNQLRLMILCQLIVARVVPQLRTSATASRGDSGYLSLSPLGRAFCVIDFDRAVNDPGS